MFVNTEAVPVEQQHSDCNFALFLPRNLSYAEESYLDSYSVTSKFVDANKGEHNLLNSRTGRSPREDRRMEYEFERYAVKVKDTEETGDAEAGDRYCKAGEDAVYETQCEEGIFVNGLDDLASIGSPTDNNNGYLSEDSINSPDETRIVNTLTDKDWPKSDKKTGKIGNDGLDLRKSSSDEILERKLSDLHVSVGGTDATDAEARRYLLYVPESPVYDEPEFNFNKSELRKSSSLKASKTPPGTPRRKKMVRFADAMGLDLESIRHVLNTDAPPKIPASAMADLKVGIEKERIDLGSRYLDLCFPQPGALENFNLKVMAHKVSLENCLITDLSITGVVRVANVGFHKCVRVRYTINNWITFYDIMASYIQNSCDGPTDRFSFTMVAPATVGPGSKIDFAVSYTVGDTVYWDNNDGQNYGVLCFAKTTPTELESSWVHFV